MGEKKLNIVLLTGSNPYNNAGIIAYDIFKSLKQQGHTVLLLTRYYDKRFESGIESIYGQWGSLIRDFILRVILKLRKKQKVDPAYCMHSLSDKKNHIPANKILSHLHFKVDVIVYLFPHRFLDSRNLFELNRKTGAPIFIMPMDMAQFTGGCHYANNCKNFERTCGHCPGLFSNKERDLTYVNLLHKQKYISKTNVHTLANTWTSNLIKRSSIYAEKPNYIINIPINETAYCPGDKADAKKFFSIPDNKIIIFFGATAVTEKRKGFSFLVDALNLLYKDLGETESKQISIAIAGDLNTEIKSLFQFDIYFLGHLNHQQLPKAFQMADVFVSPSIQDAGPMMVIQSMMCGTPVVAFEMGNAMDFIIDGETGYRVPLYNTVKLKECIITVLKKTKEEKMLISRRCRETAMSKSSYGEFEKDFISIYTKAMAYNLH